MNVSIYVFVGEGVDAEQCEPCQAPAENSTEMVAYYFELSCESICETEASPEADIASTLDCYTGPVIQDQTGTCSYSSEPITIQAMLGGSVKFTVVNTCLEWCYCQRMQQQHT